MSDNTKDFIERAFSEEERELLLKNNKYHHTDKSEFDPVDILLEGNIPAFASRGDKFRCVMAVAKFIRERDSISGIEEGFGKFLISLETDLQVLLLRHQTNNMLNRMAENRTLMKKIYSIMDMLK